MSFYPNPFTVTELLEDETFQRWMKERRTSDRLYWEKWLEAYPDKKEIYEQAVAAFLVIQGQDAHLSDEEISIKTKQILDLLPDEPSTEVKPLFQWRWLGWAAAAVFVGILAWTQLPLEGFKTQAEVVLTTRAEEKVLVKDEWEMVENTTTAPIVVLLPDNSSVVLSEASRLRFRKNDNSPTREVFLEGEGFFEVTKNPKKPFLVYTNNLTTKVLGTSFQVRAFAHEPTAIVKVKTGKVAVTSVASPAEPRYLTEHQQLRIETKTNEVSQTKVLEASLTTEEIVNQEFTYEFAPITEVLEQLHEAYNMPIEYDAEKLKSCTFTGQLNDVPFLEKVRLICLTIESTYEIADSKVIIHSRGCH